MRTLSDLKKDIERYQKELQAYLAEENKNQYIIAGGNMCVMKNPATNRYILGKGDPAPMTKNNARERLKKFQMKCGDNISLELIRYGDWLREKISAYNEMLNMCGNHSKPATDVPHVDDRKAVLYSPECPMKVNACVCCRFFNGISGDIPLTIKCSFSREKTASLS